MEALRMKRPIDRSLAQWIRELIAENRLYRFYKCDEWMDLREMVLFENNYECEDCRARGRYQKAYMVHHEREVRDYPELALSRTYRDADGEHKQLWALCYECHEKRHGRMYKGKAVPRNISDIERQVPERWD